MKTTKTMRVILLPTEKATGLFIEVQDLWGKYVNPSQRKLEYTTNETLIRNNHLISSGKAATSSKNKHTFHELYIVSDNEIKEGDWTFGDNNKVVKANTADVVLLKNRKLRGEKDFKIEATTDKSLCPRVGNSLRELDPVNALPQIPQSFVEAYVKANGKIDEVNVEISQHLIVGGLMDYNIKTRDDNTIIIHPSKTYTREEVVDKLHGILNDLLCNPTDKVNKRKVLSSPDSNKIGDFIIKWTEDNL